MCRFLMMRGEDSFETAPYLSSFRARCRASTEYQGHVWGASWRVDGVWSRYRSLSPIWDDDVEIPSKTEFLVLHARSAFRDIGIDVQNNMPFYHDKYTFVFNGELHGVRLRIPGRIGAEKIFNMILSNENRNLDEVLTQTTRLLLKKSRRVRAMNIAITDGVKIYASCCFDESPDYFTLHYRSGRLVAVCSERLDDEFEPLRSGERVTL